MGFLDDMKKLLWAKKSVAKSAAKKGAEEMKEMTSEGYDAVKGFSEDVGDKANQTLEDVKKYMAKRKDSQWDPPEEDIVPSVDDTPLAADDVVEPISNAMKKSTAEGQKIIQQAKEKGGEVLDKAVEASDQFWEKAEEVGKQVAEEGGKLSEKAKDMAKDVGDKISAKMDEMLEKAEELDKTIEAEDRAMDSDGDGFADIPTHEKLRQQGSLLKDKDDFWSKAESFAAGDYTMGKAKVVGTDDSVEPKSDDGDLKGFEDLDGDGDALMDDAIIVEDENDATTDTTSDSDEPKLMLPDGDEEE